MEKRQLQWLVVLGLLLFAAEPALAEQLSSSGIMNDVLHRFHAAASSWSTAITDVASRLFWSLVVISMVWTFGLMALRRADIAEFFAEFIKFTVFTGFFWWLLTNAVTGMNIAGTLISSLQLLGAQAGGLASTKLGPSEVVDIGFQLYDRTVQATADLGWQQMGTVIVMELMALLILIVLALVAINLLLLLAASWVLLYAGVFFLGFGGSRWTSDIAINYFRTVLGVAAQLMAMVLIVAIGKQFLAHYYAQISNNMASQELAVMLVIAIILLFLVNKVPPMISGIVSGGGLGAAGGIGSFGAGAIGGAVGGAIGAASMARAAVATGGSAITTGVTSAVGGSQALMAAVKQASANVEAGSDVVSSVVKAGSSLIEGGGDSSSPFSRAAGLGSASGADQSSGGLKAAASKAGKIAADTGANLASGMGRSISNKAAEMSDAAKTRISDTAGGRLANEITNPGERAQGRRDDADIAKANEMRSRQEKRDMGEEAREFLAQQTDSALDDNSLSGSEGLAVDVEAEVAAFTNRPPPQDT